MSRNPHFLPFVSTRGFLFFIVWSLALLLAPLQTMHASNAVTDDKLIISNVTVDLLPSGAVVISWDTNKLSSGSITYGTVAFDHEARHAGNYLSHAIVLDDVAPYSLYHYKVQSSNGDEIAESPHLLFWSQRAADLEISQLELKENFVYFAGYQPDLHNALELTVINNGDIHINQPFYVSVLVSETEESAVVAADSRIYRSSYSCFKEVKVSQPISAHDAISISIPEETFLHCDVLQSGKYRITAAVDYNDDVSEGNEINNVASTVFVVSDTDEESVYKNFEVSEVAPYSVTAHFTVMQENPGMVTLWYDTEEYFKMNNSFRWHRTAVLTEEDYQAVLKGLQDETDYVAQISSSNLNAESTIFTFSTTKDLHAEQRDLIRLKIESGSVCRTISREPLLKRYWSTLGLEMPETHIERYRIQWSNGAWSPWYIPGSGDVDWVTIGDSQRRVWSYFDDHRYQFITCNRAGDQELVDPSLIDAYIVHDEPQVLGVYYIKDE